jgi:hypothetical protein
MGKNVERRKIRRIGRKVRKRVLSEYIRKMG